MAIKKHKLPFVLLNQTWYLRGISNNLELGLLQRIVFATAVFLFLKGVNHVECNRGDLFISNCSFFPKNYQSLLGTQDGNEKKRNAKRY